jgi:hypothetical protein
MKVEVLNVKDEYNYIELIVRKHKKVIAVSTFAENYVNLDSSYLILDTIKSNFSYSYNESGITVMWVKNRNEMIAFQDETDEGKSDIIIDGHSITTYRQEDEMKFRLNFIVYYASNIKRKNNTSAMKSK